MTISSEIRSFFNKLLLPAMIAGFVCLNDPTAAAGLSLQGPSGFVQVPSHKTVDAKGVELAIHNRLYQVPGTDPRVT